MVVISTTKEVGLMAHSNVKLADYNHLVRKISTRFSCHLGVDTPAQRALYLYWVQRIRRELPYKSQKDAA